ncbi:MAG: hypothetical protein A3I61_03670 [Acidobacteria bacterium RIFCSPLOWO2_02_FULL_68_18]|nr:MAG: hypothetical protein A3I61_03670 [Acidobacteria bacterium RIFCSPLOWO2_02_FULL_68_18]OFW48757.1 MAG: hypothetical protein A3G77_14755 [Acidobacteria bacterium RIFCSPLOWO2_12_FULL_68_19]
MRKVSIQDLKANLSGVIAEVEAGTPVVVTRHNRPVVHLQPARSGDVHRGAHVGRGRLRPALARSARRPRGRSLAVLLEDRGNR